MNGNALHSLQMCGIAPITVKGDSGSYCVLGDLTVDNTNRQLFSAVLTVYRLPVQQFFQKREETGER